MFAYTVKKLYVFHNVEQEAADDLVDHLGAQKRRGAHGLCAVNRYQRSASAPCLSRMSVGLNHVAAALAHLLTLRVQDVPQTEDPFVRTASLDERGHGQKAVEPAARLVDGLADEVGREALCELLLVLERVVPLAERHGPGVEPGVDDLGGGVAFFAALRAAQHDVVDVRPVAVPGLQAPAPSPSGAARRHCRRSARDSFSQRQIGSECPSSVAAEGPVDVVGQPLAEAALFDVLGIPDDVVVGS